LIEHLDQSPLNAIYGSPRMQNRLLGIIQDHLQEEIIREARSSQYYSVLVDTTQVSQKFFEKKIFYLKITVFRMKEELISCRSF